MLGASASSADVAREAGDPVAGVERGSVNARPSPRLAPVMSHVRGGVAMEPPPIGETNRLVRARCEPFRLVKTNRCVSSDWYVPDMSRPTPPAAARPSRQAILTPRSTWSREVGYAKLSIEGIAARAGVGKQTIYRWWPSKGAVLLDALLALSEDQDGELPALPDTGDLEADLKLVLRATVEELNDPRYDAPMRALARRDRRTTASSPALYAERLDAPLSSSSAAACAARSGAASSRPTSTSTSPST